MEPGTQDFIFYDGHCGLCHRWVSFVMPRDRDGKLFCFAPLQGETFANRVPDEQRQTLPDSIIVLTTTGQLLMKSDAVLHILHQLGGFWRFLSTLGRVIPRPIRDFVYDRIASIRHKLFKKPSDACPLMPPDLRERFLP